MTANKICTFAGHRNEWDCIDIDDSLFDVLEELIVKGHTVFYDGGYGAFDKKCVRAILTLKKKYKDVKLFRVLTTYNPYWHLPDYYDGSILPELENVHFKQKITQRNKWMVDNSDIVVCCVRHNIKSGVFRTVKYAQKQEKPIIYL